jgi:hypothetical protein
VKLDTYWLNWQPLSEKVEKRLEHAPSKPSELGFAGFEGATPSHFQTISPLEAQPEAYEEGLERWIAARCIFLDGAWWGLGALHNDYAVWCDKFGREVPGNLQTFKVLVRDSGFRITDDGLVYGLALSGDLRGKQGDHDPGNRFRSGACRSGRARSNRLGPTSWPAARARRTGFTPRGLCGSFGFGRVFTKGLSGTRATLNPFRVGDRVELVSCPNFPGTVTGFVRGKVQIRFDDFKNEDPKGFRPESVQLNMKARIRPL